MSNPAIEIPTLSSQVPTVAVDTKMNDMSVAEAQRRLTVARNDLQMLDFGLQPDDHLYLDTIMLKSAGVQCPADESGVEESLTEKQIRKGAKRDNQTFKKHVSETNVRTRSSVAKEDTWPLNATVPEDEDDAPSSCSENDSSTISREPTKREVAPALRAAIDETAVLDSCLLHYNLVKQDIQDLYTANGVKYVTVQKSSFYAKYVKAGTNKNYALGKYPTQELAAVAVAIAKRECACGIDFNKDVLRFLKEMARKI